MGTAADKPTIVFFGNERLATGVTTTAPTLQALIDAGYPIAAVVSHYERSRSRNARDLEIAAVAERHDIPVLLPEKPVQILDQLKGYGATIGVLVAYGKIVPQSIIDVFPRGIVNIHPSLLPKHRGPIPLESVILEGAAETGVSIMELVRDMDAGPVYDQTVVRLHGNETKQALADLLLTHGSKMLIEALPGIIDASLPPRLQDDTQATYDALITKDKGRLDFSKPALQLEREIRAYAEWPKSYMVLGEKEVVVTQAHVQADIEGATGTIWLDDSRRPRQFGFHTSRGVLVIDTLKPAGKADMTVQAFIAGYSNLLTRT